MCATHRCTECRPVGRNGLTPLSGWLLKTRTITVQCLWTNHTMRLLFMMCHWDILWSRSVKWHLLCIHEMKCPFLMPVAEAGSCLGVISWSPVCLCVCLRHFVFYKWHILLGILLICLSSHSPCFGLVLYICLSISPI